MKLLKKVGFFRELSYGDDNGLSLRESINSFPQENEDKTAKYLKNGVLFIACFGVTHDILDESSDFTTEPHILTDGTWAWFNELSYYVEKYHVKLPDDFLVHMESSNWLIPSEEEIDLLGLEIEE
jgi:hypothetical protein